MFPRKKESIVNVNNTSNISNSNHVAGPVRKTARNLEEIELQQHIQLQPAASE
jgi:hypothetical protein